MRNFLLATMTCHHVSFGEHTIVPKNTLSALGRKWYQKHRWEQSIITKAIIWEFSCIQVSIIVRFMAFSWTFLPKSLLVVLIDVLIYVFPTHFDRGLKVRLFQCGNLPCGEQKLRDFRTPYLTKRMSIREYSHLGDFSQFIWIIFVFVNDGVLNRPNVSTHVCSFSLLSRGVLKSRNFCSPHGLSVKRTTWW